MKQTRKCNYILLTGAFTISIILSTESFSQDLSQEDQITVSASASPSSLADAPASINIITNEEINRAPVSSLKEIISESPGVSGGYSLRGPLSNISIRGLPSRYTLILIDGRRVGSSTDLYYFESMSPQMEIDSLPIDSIDHIEVIRGPMSTLYGSDAMGGVINILTKKRNSKAWNTRLKTNYVKPSKSYRGETTQFGLTTIGPISENLQLMVSLDKSRRNADENNFNYGPRANNYISGFDNQNLLSKLTWFGDNNNFGVEASRNIRKGINSSAVDSNGDPLVSTERWGLPTVVHDRYGIFHEGSYQKLHTSLSIYQNLFKDKGFDNRDSYGASTKETVIDGKVTFPLDLILQQAFSIGFQWDKSSSFNPGTIGNIGIDVFGNEYSDNKNSLSAINKSIYSEDQIFLTEDLSLTLGLRMDEHPSYGRNYSPRAYAVYHLFDDWTVKGGYSRGYRSPNLKENAPNTGTFSAGYGCTELARFGWVDMGQGCYIAGNKNLKAETSDNYEAGIQYDRDGYSFSATYFISNFKNKIIETPLGEKNGNWWVLMDNAEKARTRGIEISSTIPLTSNVSWVNNATRMLESKNISTGQPLNSTPNWKVTSSIDWLINENLSSSFKTHYIGDNMYSGQSTFVKKYVNSDVSAKYKASKQATVIFGVNNIFGNGSRAKGLDYDDGGREIFTGLTYDF